MSIVKVTIKVDDVTLELTTDKALALRDELVRLFGSGAAIKLPYYEPCPYPWQPQITWTYTTGDGNVGTGGTK